MNRLVEFFVRRFVFAISIFGTLVLFGVVSALNVGVNLLPQVNFPVVIVQTVYPGAGSEEVVEQVTEPIEGAVATLPGLSAITSTSSEGFSIVVVNFDADVDADQAAIDVSQRVNGIRGQLPDDAEAPSVQQVDPNEEPILRLAVSAPGVALQDVRQFAEDEIQPRLQRVDGVADVSVQGSVEREFRVQLDPNALRNYGLSPGRVVSALSDAAVNVPLGDLSYEQQRVLFAGRNLPTDLDDVAEVLVDSQQGIRVRDVGTVRDTIGDVNSYTRLNGEPVVLLQVLKKSESNVVATADRVKREIDRLDLPTNYTTTVVGDETTFISSTVNGTIRGTIISVVAVAFVVLLFVGQLGSVASVVIAIPITFSGAMIMFGLLDYTFNIITLLAITVAVGLVVDDSIVIAENIDRLRKEGLGQKQAAIQGAGEVSAAVLASTLSLLAVFLPISFLPGLIGQFFSQFGLTLAIAIFFSYLEALFFLTVRLAYLPDPLPPRWSVFKQLPQQGRRALRWSVALVTSLWSWLAAVAAVATFYVVALYFVAPLPADLWALAGLALPLALAVVVPVLFLVMWTLLNVLGALARTLYDAGDWGMVRLRRGYTRVLESALNHSTFVLIGAVLVFLSIIPIVPRLGFNFTPPIDSGQLDVTLELPTGTPLDRTNELITRFENELIGDPQIVRVQATIGEGQSQGAVSLTRSNPNRGSLLIELVDTAERQRTSQQFSVDVEERLQPLLSDVPSANLDVSVVQSAGPPGTSDYQIILSSESLSLLRERNDQAQRLLEQSPYLRNVNSDLSAVVDERVLQIDSAALVGSGLSPQDIYGTFRLYNVGSEAGEVRIGGESVPIRVIAEPTSRASEQLLLSLPVFAPGLASPPPLGEFGTFALGEAPATIPRTNQAFSAELTANLVPGAPSLSQVRSELETQLRDQGILDNRVAIGESAQPDLTGELASATPIAFGLALLLNYLVIASQFNTFRYPLYLLLSVPLALVGAFWTLFIADTPLDVNSALGTVILIGIVTKNAILLLDVVVTRLDDADMSLKEALVEAGRLRLRPILMTAITVVAISMPLLLGVGSGSEFRRPLGLVIFGGVLSSALLTLFVVPAAFYRFERGRYEGTSPESSDESSGSSSEPESQASPQPRAATD